MKYSVLDPENGRRVLSLDFGKISCEAAPFYSKFTFHDSFFEAVDVTDFSSARGGARIDKGAFPLAIYTCTSLVRCRRRSERVLCNLLMSSYLQPTTSYSLEDHHEPDLEKDALDKGLELMFYLSFTSVGLLLTCLGYLLFKKCLKPKENNERSVENHNTINNNIIIVFEPKIRVSNSKTTSARPFSCNI